MALLVEELSVWEIAFRWEGIDPSKAWLRIPQEVRDRLRSLINAIYYSELRCETIKYGPDHPEHHLPPDQHIGRHITQILACLEGRKYDKKMLQWAKVSRHAMQRWCESNGIPLPGFWFPSFQTQEQHEQIAPVIPIPNTTTTKPPSETKKQRLKRLFQEAGLLVWEREKVNGQYPDIKVIADHPEVIATLGSENREFKTLCDWLGEVDPRPDSQKRGRRRNNNSRSGKPVKT